jgi:hypothetical protein
VRALIRPRDQDPLLQASGMIEGLPRDLSADFDRYLEETFLVPNAQTRKKARRRTRKRVRR